MVVILIKKESQKLFIGVWKEPKDYTGLPFVMDLKDGS